MEQEERINATGDATVPKRSRLDKEKPDANCDTQRQKRPKFDNEKPDGDCDTERQFPAVVELNVGGYHFTTLLTTLTKEPDSMLATLFSGRHTVNRDENGRYFIDADGAIFSHLLNFLRVEQLPPTDDSSQVCRYAEYFGIQSLVDKLKQNDDIIELNVGGRHFTTHISVLLKNPESKLAQMFENGHDALTKSQDGRYFIDSDGDAFFHILHFLRHGELPPAEASLSVYRVANFLGITSLVKKLENFSSLNPEKIGSLYKSQSNVIEAILDTLVARLDGEANIYFLPWDSDEDDLATANAFHTSNIIQVQGVENDKDAVHFMRYIVYRLSKLGWQVDSWFLWKHCNCCNASIFKIKLKLPHAEARVIKECEYNCGCRM